MNTKNIAAVAAYTTAIVTANLTVAHWGPSVSIVNAFLLIGLDLVLRDYLHDRWSDHLVRNMGLLIVGAGVVSYALNQDAGRIALASSAAFMLAAVADWAVYAAAHRLPWIERSNLSNIAGSGVDSIAFPAIAFGLPLLPAIMFGQFVAKVAGGSVWSLLIAGSRRIEAAR